MNRKQRGWLPLLLAIVLLAGCGDDEPAHTLTGTWELIGFTNQGVPGTATGDAMFGEGGDFEITGEVTHPGDPPDTFTMSGAWSQTGDRVTLTTLMDSGEWTVRYLSGQATLTLVGDEPTDVIRLCCRVPGIK
jgi:hypothetical protein